MSFHFFDPNFMQHYSVRLLPRLQTVELAQPTEEPILPLPCIVVLTGTLYQGAPQEHALPPVGTSWDGQMHHLRATVTIYLSNAVQMNMKILVLAKFIKLFFCLTIHVVS